MNQGPTVSYPRLKVLLTVCLLCGLAARLAADPVQGWWQSADSVLYVHIDDGQAHIVAAGILNPALVRGEPVSWSAAQPLLDGGNSQPELRTRPLLGLDLAENYTRQKKRWQGNLYDPRSGRQFQSHMSVVEGDLSIRAYVGTPMFGQTRIFQPYDPCRTYGDSRMVLWAGATAPVCLQTN
ncbi:MAG: DUF2147 domain-containing protein [Proteobacteria bacterium]|nr:DUF2147 domain-containing protein [Pseudomonadota bacterium]